jgi:hypothetical protein
MRTPFLFFLFTVGLAATACSTASAPIAQQAPAQNRSAEQLLADAEATLAAHPDDPEAWIWKGRRLGYLGRYDDAIAVFSSGLERFPGDARFLRHRGHRLITQRRFADAEADLQRAWTLEIGRPDAIEPDGLPNAANIPTSTTQGNIGYHWGLALYLQGRFAEAAQVYRATLPVAKHPDMEVATRYWLTLALRRAGKDDEARETMRFRPASPLLESFAYEKLLAMMRGEIDPGVLLVEARSAESDLDFPTIGYGVGAHLALVGAGERARGVLREVTSGASRAAFGFIAAEADLNRE